jgi:hypothetical protein
VIESAKNLLARGDIAGEPDPTRRIHRLFQLAFGREATADEVAWARQFMSETGTPEAAWTELAQGLFEANEFLFVD